MKGTEPTIDQGKALVCAIEALETIKPRAFSGEYKSGSSYGHTAVA